MNEVMKCIKERRSVKKYKAEQIKTEDLDSILEAGTYAANGKAMQAAKMVVVQDTALIQELAKMNAEVMGASGNPFYGAPTVVIVLADKNISTHIEDGSLVIGNLMLAAKSLGIGSCWIHRAKQVFETARGKELLRQWGVEENYIGIGNCLLGYADGESVPVKPRKADYVIKI